jgi:hypothetical protein
LKGGSQRGCRLCAILANLASNVLHGAFHGDAEIGNTDRAAAYALKAQSAGPRDGVWHDGLVANLGRDGSPALQRDLLIAVGIIYIYIYINISSA